MKNSKFISTIWDCQKGVALLPAILAILALVLVVGVAISNISISENIISKNNIDSDVAFAVAEAGVEDALIKIVRNKNFINAGYNLSASLGSATITVSGMTTKTISSVGMFNNKSKKIVVVISVDANGKITQDSWSEVAP